MKLTLKNAPQGTKAPSIIGGYWIRTARGWKANGGDTFPTPGGDWSGALIPPHHDRLVTVCDHCKCACCWQGKFFCDRARYAGTEEMTVSQLRPLERESPEYWFTNPADGSIDRESLSQYNGWLNIEQRQEVTT